MYRYIALATKETCPLGIALTDVAPPSARTTLSSPEAIQACLASLAAEAFDGGHSRAAQVLAHAAALLNQPDLWNRAKPKSALP